MVKKKEKKGGKKRATGETKKSSRRDKEARDRLKRFLKKRAPDLSISTALDIQFPALVSLLRVREFGALAGFGPADDGCADGYDWGEFAA